MGVSENQRPSERSCGRLSASCSLLGPCIIGPVLLEYSKRGHNLDSRLPRSSVDLGLRV